MLRVVFDTNVLVSALIKTGKPRKLWRKVLDKKLKSITSIQIVNELDEVLKRPKFSRYIDISDVQKFVDEVSRVSEFVKTTSRFNLIKEDMVDNIILSCAYGGKADCIVSGDEHLLALKEFRRIKIVAASELLRSLTSAS